MHAVAERLNTIAEELNEFYLERRDLIHVCMLALVCGQHVFILGTPGTGKSDLVRSIIKHIVNVRWFEIGMSRTRGLEAVMGPQDLKHYRETGELLLKREGYLSMVELALIDEIGRMSQVLGDGMLPLLNERLIHEVRDGQSFHPSPLSTAFCPSNSMITDDAEDAAALWDRMLLRAKVEEIQDPSNFIRLLQGGEYEARATIEWEDLSKAIKVDVPAITVSDEALMAMAKLRREFDQQHLPISARRWKQSVKALKAEAFLNGRDVVTEDDLHVLRFTLWETLEQIDKVERLTMTASNPYIGKLFEFRAQLNEISDGISTREDYTNEDEKLALLSYGGEVNKKLNQVRDGLDLLLIEAQGRKIPGFKVISDLHHSLLVRNYVTCLGNDREVAEQAASKKLGSGDGGNT